MLFRRFANIEITNQNPTEINPLDLQMLLETWENQFGITTKDHKFSTLVIK